ncbi:MAG: DNA polymerase/3'-5' exonuclease PolX [Bacteroidia bacterium]
MTNDEIADVLKMYAQLYELHGGNPFKIKSYNAAVFRIDKFPVPLSGKTEEELAQIDGIGKSLAEKIAQIDERGTFTDLDDLISETPEGVFQMLRIKGLGPKKVQVIWKELGIESVGELLYACHENRLAQAKGFGQKTQESVVKSIEFAAASAGKFHYAAVEELAHTLLKSLQQFPFVLSAALTGEVRRKSEIINAVEFVLATDDSTDAIQKLSACDLFHEVAIDRNILTAKWNEVPVKIHLTSEQEYIYHLWQTTGVEAHNTQLNVAVKNYSSEEEIYNSHQLDYIVPELREGTKEIELAKSHSLPRLVEVSDLKGTLHNHSTYSDGSNTLEQMALECIKRSYEYLGICDHSKSAQYAGGLKEDRIIAQHNEIDVLNKKLGPFKIFKGIESDILNDGSLDYTADVLSSFDFVVASVHSNLKMNEEKAMGRLLKAIENPYTTILGHPTGRLLLIREGYPVDHKKMIDACAANGVIIELNAHPYRLDMDWRWISYALDKGVKISINPDAHNTAGFSDMYYGVCVARKGFLTADMCFNALTQNEISAYFAQRKAGK